MWLIIKPPELPAKARIGAEAELGNMFCLSEYARMTNTIEKHMVLIKHGHNLINKLQHGLFGIILTSLDLDF